MAFNELLSARRGKSMAGSNNYATVKRYFSPSADGTEKIRRELLPEATTDRYGAVLVTDDIMGVDESDPSFVPSIKALKDYIADHQGISVDDPNAVPNATTMQRGVVRLADNVWDKPDDLVPTVELLRQTFFNDEGTLREEIMPPLLDLPEASTTVKGITRFAVGIDEDDPDKAVSSRLVYRTFFDPDTNMIRLELLPNIKGDAGRDGGWYTPHLTDDGVLSWTNNCDRPNPPEVNLHGRDGVDGVGATVTIGNIFWQTGMPKTQVRVANVGTPWSPLRCCSRPPCNTGDCTAHRGS